MKKPFTPDINLYSEILPFLQDFYQLNKDKNQKFSYRFLASKLKWSAPYLNDVFKGRRKLSLKRALEFVQFLNLNELAEERFLFLLLSDLDVSFSNSDLKNRALGSRNSNPRSTLSLEEFTMFNTLYDYYILYYIDMHKGKWDQDDFLKKLKLSDKPSGEMIQDVLKRLQKNKLLTFDSKTKLYQIHDEHAGDNRILDEMGAPHSDYEKIKAQAILNQEREYVSNYLNYLQNPVNNRRTFVSGMVNMDLDQYVEASKRLFALRNYMFEIDRKNQEDMKQGKTASNMVWQFSMSMFSLFEDTDPRGRT